MDEWMVDDGHNNRQIHRDKKNGRYHIIRIHASMCHPILNEVCWGAGLHCSGTKASMSRVCGPISPHLLSTDSSRTHS